MTYSRIRHEFYDHAAPAHPIAVSAPVEVVLTVARVTGRGPTVADDEVTFVHYVRRADRDVGPLVQSSWKRRVREHLQRLVVREGPIPPVPRLGHCAVCGGDHSLGCPRPGR